MLRSLFSKYIEIIAAVAVFIVLDAGVLLLNFYTSYQISDDAHAIRLAGQQSALTQRIFYSVTQMKDDLEEGRNFEQHQQNLALSFKQFNEVLDAFIYGGSLIGQGFEQDDLLVDEAYRKLSEEHLLEVESIWKSYRQMISSLVYADFYEESLDSAELIDKADKAIVYANENGEVILNQVTSFAQAVEDVAHNKAVRLRLVQATAIGLAVINFFFILFHFLRRLNRSDVQIYKAQKENNEIMETVSDGLLLINKDCEIGTQYSSSLKTMFRLESFEQKNFIELLQPLVDQETITVLLDYIDALFNERVKSSLMDELNPLQQVEITITDKLGKIRHFFSFEFTRVYENEEIVHLLVSVRDITELVELRHKLKESQRQIGQETESLLTLINMDRQKLFSFLNILDQYLSEINSELEKSSYNNSGFTEKLNRINRLVHTLKGESSAVDISLIEQKVHQLEDRLQPLKEKLTLDGNDFIGVAVELNELTRIAEYMRLLASRFGSPVNALDNTYSENAAVSPLSTMLTQLVTKVGEHCNKQVSLNIAHFDESLIPVDSVPTLKNILIQLVRNSIVHGLEAPKKRENRGKSPVGVVTLSTEVAGNDIAIRVKDDGRGINFKSIKNYLLNSGEYTEEQVDAMTPRELVRFIFQPGFSSAKKVDQYAGRGIGLDVVKSSIDELGGSLSVSCKAKQSTEFRLLIPSQAAVLQTA